MWRRNQDVRFPTPRCPKDQPSHVWYLRQNWNRQVSIEASATSLRFAIIGAGRLGASLALALRSREQLLTGFTAGSSAGLARAHAWLGVPGVPTLADLVETRPDLYVDLRPRRRRHRCSRRSGHRTWCRSWARCWNRRRAHQRRHLRSPRSRPARRRERRRSSSIPCRPSREPLTGATRFAGAGVALTPGPVRPDEAGATGMRLARRSGDAPVLSCRRQARPVPRGGDRRLQLPGDSRTCGERAVRRGRGAGASPLSLFLPLVTATLENLAARGPVEALTGPLSRGDVATVASHLQALAADAPAPPTHVSRAGRSHSDLVAARSDVSHHTLERLDKLRPPQRGRPPHTRPGPRSGRQAGPRRNTPTTKEGFRCQQRLKSQAR